MRPLLLAASLLLAAHAIAQQPSIAPGSPPLVVSGLGWFHEDAPALRRLPLRLKDSFRPPVWSLAQHASGARIRLRTDSSRITVAASNPETSTMHHMTSVGQSGLDLYVDGAYRASAWPDKQGRIQREWILGTAGTVREVTLYLPLYNGIQFHSLKLDDAARVEPPTPFATPRPVVFYGSSITQGGCAENPGLSFPAILGRRLNIDFINLGFSGSGMGEPALAHAIAELKPSAIVLDHWANPSPAEYRDSLAPFLKTLRAAHPAIPVLVVSPFFYPAELASPETRSSQESKRSIARTFVAAQRKAGDRNIHLVDGLRMIDSARSHGLVDGVHPNSLGFQDCADALEPILRRVLRLRR